MKTLLKRITVFTFIFLAVIAVAANQKHADASGFPNTVAYPATNCRVAAGTPTYDAQGQIANASTTQTLILYCPVPADTSYTVGTVNFYAYSTANNFLVCSGFAGTYCYRLCVVDWNGGNGSTACSTSLTSYSNYGQPLNVQGNIAETNISFTGYTQGTAVNLEVAIAPTPGAWNVFYGYSFTHS